MTSKRHRHRSPVTMPAPIRAGGKRGRASRGDGAGLDALDAPMPGRLLVLLNRLHRAEIKPNADGKQAG